MPRAGPAQGRNEPWTSLLRAPPPQLLWPVFPSALWELKTALFRGVLGAELPILSLPMCRLLPSLGPPTMWTFFRLPPPLLKPCSCCPPHWPPAHLLLVSPAAREAVRLLGWVLPPHSVTHHSPKALPSPAQVPAYHPVQDY